MTIFTDSKNNQFDKIISFSSQLSNLSFAESTLLAISEKVEISSDVYGNILLSLSEAINNAIVHGNQLSESKQVYVAYKIEGKLLHFYVKDEGAGFDHELVADPTEIENLEKLTGRGVFIILTLADTVEFSYDGGQIIKMTFNLLP